MFDPLNGDILFSIFENLDYVGPIDMDITLKQKTLACSARVCQAFYLPAIRILWRRLEDLIPLLSVLCPLQRSGRKEITLTSTSMRSSQTARSREEGYVLHLGLRWTPHLAHAIASQSTRYGVHMDIPGGYRDLAYYPSVAGSSPSFHQLCDLWAQRFPALKVIECNFDIPIWGSQRGLLNEINPQPISQVIKPLSIFDLDITEIVTTWTDLQTLKLDFSAEKPLFFSFRSTPCPGLTSLYLLAVHCPNLQTLWLHRIKLSDQSLMDEMEELAMLVPPRPMLVNVRIAEVEAEDLPRSG
ncbi:hypothetical protein C8Q74DRAFT_1370150 [Fomes fomentarius]|nr:hypothetical protein C8Q74DRAFT_1370150 [Fomes fomentarius]